MPVAVLLPLLSGALFALLAPGLSRRLPPALATWLLTIGGVGVAASFVATLALLAAPVVGQIPLVAHQGHWSDAVLQHANPVWPPLAITALIVLLVLAARSVAATLRRVSALRTAYRLARSLSSTGSELVVIDDAGHQAYAVPGRPGRIVMSSGLLRALTAHQRRAVLAHERAHLRQHHHLHHAAADLAVAAAPITLRLRSALALATERWADETAGKVCSRSAVAGALTLAAHTAPRSHGVGDPILAVADTEVAARIDALSHPASPLTLWRLALMVALLLAVVVSTQVAAADVDRVFDLAQAAYHVGGH
jgi:Zn-dependent protease with chaperone function